MIRALSFASLVVLTCAACGSGDGAAGEIKGPGGDVHDPIESSGVAPGTSNAPPADDTLPPADTSLPPADTSLPPPDTRLPPGSATGFGSCPELCEPVYGCLFDCAQFCEAASTVLTAECQEVFFPLLECVVAAGITCEDLQGGIDGQEDLDPADILECAEVAQSTEELCDFGQLDDPGPPPGECDGRDCSQVSNEGDPPVPPP